MRVKDAGGRRKSKGVVQPEAYVFVRYLTRLSRRYRGLGEARGGLDPKISLVRSDGFPCTNSADLSALPPI